MRYLLQPGWALLWLCLVCLTLPALAAAGQPPTEGGSRSLLAASLFLLVFVLIALANLAIFRGGRQRWRKGAGLSSGAGFGGFGGGFSGFGSEGPAGGGWSARGFLR